MHLFPRAYSRHRSASVRGSGPLMVGLTAFFLICSNVAMAQHQGVVARGNVPTPTGAAPNMVAPTVHPLDPALQLLRTCRDRFASVRDYTAIFVKQERINGNLLPACYLQAKFRQRPFSVYFKWMQPSTGREALYVEGMNSNKILSHTTGFAKVLTGTIKVDPDSSLARKENRHSIREAGIGNMLNRLITGWEFDRRYNETEVQISNVTINQRPCYLITTLHPYPDTGKFMYHTLKVYVDKELAVPIRLEGYAYGKQPGRTPGPLLECYTYLNLRLNAGLTDADFSPRNREYAFNRF